MGKKSKKKTLTEIVCVLDRSGSMNSIIDDAIGGFNTFLQDQKELDEGMARMTIAMFDDDYELICESKDIQDVEDFTRNTYVPRGSTALNDAIGKTITTVGEIFNKRDKKDKPDNVVFVILTDGRENASREYQIDRVKELIGQNEKDNNWKFIFLSSDVDAFTQGSSFGISHTSHMVKTGKGTRSAYNYLSSSVKTCRSTGDISNVEKNIK